MKFRIDPELIVDSDTSLGAFPSAKIGIVTAVGKDVPGLSEGDPVVRAGDSAVLLGTETIIGGGWMPYISVRPLRDGESITFSR